MPWCSQEPLFFFPRLLNYNIQVFFCVRGQARRKYLRFFFLFWFVSHYLSSAHLDRTFFCWWWGEEKVRNPSRILDLLNQLWARVQQGPYSVISRPMMGPSFTCTAHQMRPLCINTRGRDGWQFWGIQRRPQSFHDVSDGTAVATQCNMNQPIHHYCGGPMWLYISADVSTKKKKKVVKEMEGTL